MIEAADFLVLFGGLIYLTIGGDLLVRGALALSRRSRISPLVVGLTVVAMGTSAPELLVSLYAAISGHGEIAIGNVVGSNITNVLLVIGLPALISPIAIPASGVRSHTVFMMLVSGIFIGLCFLGPLSWPHGIVLVGVLAVGLLATFRGMASFLEVDADEVEIDRVLGIPSQLPMIAFFIVLGILLLPLGADLAVEGAVAIASGLGVREAVIGASIVALGTSLPELSTTVIAAMHRTDDVAIGNVIGSNVLNILAIMGLTVLIAPVPVPAGFLTIDLWVMLFSGGLLWVLVLAGRPIGRAAGGILVTLYAAYLLVIFAT